MDSFKTEKMKKTIILLLIPLAFFLLIKISNLGLRLSDTNIYFSTVDQIFQGKLLYRDIFFSNFPVFTYVASIYYLLAGKNIELFYVSSIIEATIIAILIYYIIYKKTKDSIVSLVSSNLYIFSFIVLATSDHQTGVFTASLFAVLGYLFLQRNRLFLSGAFVALSFFTKAYFIPIATAFFVFLITEKDFKRIFNFSVSFIATGIIVILPFLLLAPNNFFGDIFGFSLTRPSGLLKSNIAWFFITKDFLLFILLIFNLLNFKKNSFFAFISIFSLVLFFGFQDIYYLYLNFIVPFLCLSFYEFYYFLNKTLKLQKHVIPSLVFIILIINLYTYFLSFRDLQKINNLNQIVKTIQKEKPSFLYGVDDITPALLYITKIPPLEGVIDAHEYFFTKKVYDKNYLTKKAVEKKTIIITHGAFYPELNIEEKIIDGIFDKNLLLQKCNIIKSFPVKSEGITNRINLFKCY